MILIAHRGNINGPNPDNENTIPYIKKTLEEGYDIEIDVRYVNGSFMLGHNNPNGWAAPIEMLQDERVWVHAKTIETLYELLQISNVHCFYHDFDNCTLTSKGFIWTYPGQKLTPKSICIIQGHSRKITKEYVYLACGICSDFVGKLND
jgi:HKD family nuclease